MIETLRSLFLDTDAQARLDLLARIPLFGGLTRKELFRVDAGMVERVYRNGDEIFKEGDPGYNLVIVKAGRIEIVKKLSDSSAKILRVMGPGDFFGEMALLDPIPRTATALAAEDSTVFLFDKIKLEGLMLDCPTAGMRIMGQFSRILSDRFRELEARMLSEEAPKGLPEGKDDGRIQELERTLGRATLEIDRLKDILAAHGLEAPES